MKKRILLFLACTMAALLLCACANELQSIDTEADTTTSEDVGSTPAAPENPNPDYVINSFYDLNKISNATLSHENESGYSALELDRRSVVSLNMRDLKTTTAYYPRIKLMADGRYVMFYQSGEHGPNIYYTTSADLEKWDAPTLLFSEDTTNKIMYATCDAVVLDNGEILAVCSYRQGNDYDVHPERNGIVMKKSSDNAKTWSEQKKIYVGTTWEPYPMQLKSGEVQVYFTNTTCYYKTAVADASTGTALVRSYDRGESWTGDLSVPYSAQIVSQTATRVSAGTQLYSDQMPVGIELLGSGKLMLALETRLDKNGSYRITLSYSGDNFATPLDKNAQGPSEKIAKAWTGAAPYLRQFISGEIVCAYTRSNMFTYRMIDASGKRYGTEDIMPFENISKSYWGSIELIDTHTIIGIGESFNQVTVTRVENSIDYGKLNLNHSITAKSMSPTVDGDASDWKQNDEAFFIGSESQAQACVRSAVDADGLYLLIERLDEYLETDKDCVSVFFEAKSGAGYYRLTVSCEGIVSFDYFDGKKFNSIDKSHLLCAVKVNATADYNEDVDMGYSVEVKIPLSSVNSSISGGYVMYLNMQNSDKGTKSPIDLLSSCDIQDKSTWLEVKFK